MDLFSFLSLENISALIIAFIVFHIIHHWFTAPKNLPPGPLRLPFIGSVYRVGLAMNYKKLTNLVDDYGHVYRIQIFNKTFIILNSLESFEEAMLQRNDFAYKGSHDKYCWQVVNPHSKGIFVRDLNENLVQNRNNTISIFRNLGVGKDRMEVKISQEANELIRIFTEHDGKSFNPSETTACSVANVMLHIMWNERLDYDDKTLKTLLINSSTYIANIMYVYGVNSLPVTRFIEPIKTKFNQWTNAHRGLMSIVSEKVKAILEANDSDAYIEGQAANFIELYKLRFNKTHLDIEDLLYTVHDLMTGGMETSMTTLKWTLIYLANRQDIQQKLYEEIARVAGHDDVTLAHKDDLHYLQAVVLEVQRFSSILPVMPRMSNPKEETKLFNYTIPKSTSIILNIYAVHMNKDTWGDPEVFRPERFINDDGVFVKSKHVVSFSIGKRSCVGELLAKQELFLYTGLIFQNLCILPPEGVERIDETPATGGSLSPQEFEIRVLPRTN